MEYRAIRSGQVEQLIYYICIMLSVPKLAANLYCICLSIIIQIYTEATQVIQIACLSKITFVLTKSLSLALGSFDLSQAFDQNNDY